MSEGSAGDMKVPTLVLQRKKSYPEKVIQLNLYSKTYEDG